VIVPPAYTARLVRVLRILALALYLIAVPTWIVAIINSGRTSTTIRTTQLTTLATATCFGFLFAVSSFELKSAALFCFGACEEVEGSASTSGGNADIGRWISGAESSSGYGTGGSSESGGLGKLGGDIGAGSGLLNVSNDVPFQAGLLSASCSKEGPRRGIVWPNDGLP
jgi:hypothetical protein